MSFRFNFASSHDNEGSKVSNESSPSKELTNTYSIPCEYIFTDERTCESYSSLSSKFLTLGDFKLFYIAQENIEQEVKETGLLKDENSDLLPGKYEGGFKVWECSIDLAHYLLQNNIIQPSFNVLELGCGVGLPGIVSYIAGAKVTFQDFNSEVLKLVTRPSVWLNTDEEKQSNILEKCKFLCGDWQQVKNKYFNNQEVNQFDIILTSETIYEKCNQRKLLDLMKSALKCNGVIYLAAKVYYFGVGGGVVDFEKLLSDDDTFEFSTVYQTKEGVERKILKLQHKSRKS